MEVTRYKDLNLDKLSYSKPENQQNVYYGPMQYKEKNLHIQTAKLTLKEVKEDAIEIDTAQGTKEIFNYVDSHQITIENKVKIILDHFFNKSEKSFCATLAIILSSSSLLMRRKCSILPGMRSSRQVR